MPFFVRRQVELNTHFTLIYRHHTQTHTHTNGVNIVKIKLKEPAYPPKLETYRMNLQLPTKVTELRRREGRGGEGGVRGAREQNIRLTLPHSIPLSCLKCLSPSHRGGIERLEYICYMMYSWTRTIHTARVNGRLVLLHIYSAASKSLWFGPPHPPPPYINQLCIQMCCTWLKHRLFNTTLAPGVGLPHKSFR